MKGFLIAAPTSGSGKTVVTLALLRALKDRGIALSPVKAGPDYIDPLFHQAACDVSSYNLDPWAMRPDLISALSSRLNEGGRTIVIEGMMGLYDGAADGTGSSADLAYMLAFPVVLVVDCAKQSHSIAAVVRGFISHMPGLYIAGIILNKVGGPRHERMLRDALAPLAVSILGVIHRDPDLVLEERHLGLVQAQECKTLNSFIQKAADKIASCVDIDTIIRISDFAGNLAKAAAIPRLAPLGQHIAVARDDAFSFCYAHLLGGWRRRGAEISFFSPLNDEVPSQTADAVYLPGGYPELHAQKLSQNKIFMDGLRRMAANGAPVYGECGGYMVLGRSLEDENGFKHDMLGLLPLETSFKQKKLHLGYRLLEAMGDFPWRGHLRGHEYHYTSIISESGATPLFKARDALGTSLGDMGLREGNVAGSFIHILDMEE